MPIYPGATYRQLTVPNRAKNPVLMQNPVRVNLHTAVGGKNSLFGFFNSPSAGGVFSHFLINWAGGVEQYQDTKYRASCDLDGNPDTISFETADNYPTGWRNDSDVPALNDAQLEAAKKLTAWIFDNHPTIPMKLATDNRRGSTSHGLSVHRFGVVGAPGYIPATQGGLRYSTAAGKLCPGARKIAQLPLLLPNPVVAPIVEPGGVLGMAHFEEHKNSKTQQVVKGQTDPYLVTHNSGWWWLHSKPGLTQVTFFGYASAGPDSHIWAEAKNSRTGKIRNVARAPLPSGNGGFNGTGTFRMEDDEVLRLKVSSASREVISVHNITSQILYEG